MELIRLMQDIELPSDAAQYVLEHRNLLSAHSALIRDLTDSGKAENAYAALDRMFDCDLQMLCCQLGAALLDRETYISRGIPDSVFIATMKCFTRFLEETRHSKGRLSFDRGWWSWRQTSMRLFRIGELEYELIPGEKIISLHIPSDANIDSACVNRSVEEAKKFMALHFPEYAGSTIECHSWLLSPALLPYLKEDSRILAFQKRFQIRHTDPQPMDILEWVFRVPEDTPMERLPENTSLQRNLKQLLLDGGSVGVADGIML